MPTILPGDIVVGDSTTMGVHFCSPSGADQLENLLLNSQTALQSTRTDVVLTPDRSLAFVALSVTPFIAKIDVAAGTRAANPTNLPAGAANRVAISPDGAEIAVGHATTPYFTRYNASDMTVVASPDIVPTGTGWGAGYSPNGTWLAVGHQTSPFVSLYDRATNTKLSNPGTLPPTTVTRAVFSPDSSKLACVCENTSPRIRIYNTSDWSAVSLSATLGSAAFYEAAWSPDGGKLAVGSSSGSASTAFYVYDTSTWTFITLPSLTGYKLGRVRAMQWFGSDVLMVVMDSTPANALIIDIANTTILREVDTGVSVLSGAYVAPGGSFRRIAGTVFDGESDPNPLERNVRAYDRATGKLIGSAESNASGDFEMFVFHGRTASVQAVGTTENSQLIDSVIPIPV